MTPPDSTDKALPPSPETYRYPPAPGGLPPQGLVESHGAVFTEAYAFIPQPVMRDIVTSFLPHWQGLRAWVLARPMTGFSETFSHYLCALAPSGGSTAPEPLSLIHI